MTTRIGIMAAAGFAALAVASPAQAAPTLNGACTGDIAAQAGLTLISCIGGYTGNALSNADNATINTALTALGYAGPAINYSSIPAGNILTPLAGGLTINFPGFLNGVNYIGIHYGFQGGGETFFYKVNATNIDSFTLTPGSGGGSSSTATLLVFSTSAVPEPATWAMMIIGFGAMGASLRRRKVSASVSFA